MKKMTMTLTKLYTVKIAAGSQIRMEMYAKAEDKYAIYQFNQDTSPGLEQQIDMIVIDSDDAKSKVRREAKRRIADIGDTSFCVATTNILDVKLFSPKSHVTRAHLKFTKAVDKGFVLALYSNPGSDAGAVCSWKVKGKIDSSFYTAPIRGKVMRVDARPAFLIDL